MGKYATKEQLTSLVAYMANQINVASGTAGISGGYAPIGTIIAYMGKTAPEDHLICDGTLHQIATYPQLADFFYEQFGASNYFGGNGTTTFAVPDLRGEFLRGSGTNSHENQGDGGEVGEHQNGTLFPDVKGVGSKISASSKGVSQYDKAMLDGTSNVNSSASTSGSGYSFTSRPTNTSILWCIKAVDLKPNEFSTDETMIGHWIDGRPLYQKVIYISEFPNKESKVYPHNIPSIDQLIDISASMLATNGGVRIFPNDTSTIFGDRTNVTIVCTSADYHLYSGYVFLKYTKSTN